MKLTQHRRSTRLLASVAVVSTATLGLLVAPSATASNAPERPAQVLTREVLAPFQLAVNKQRIYTTDGFTGVLSRVTSAGLTPVATGIPGLAGIDFTTNGTSYAYTWSNDEHTAGGLTITSRGHADVVGDIAAVEASTNPDQVNTYGIIAGGNPCAEEILGNLTGGSATYTGQLDIHPYSVARVGSRWVVADAGANALFSVSDSGVVSTLSVLPPQPVTLTQDMVDALTASFEAPPGSMDCLTGVTYAFEPVPTDVEVDRDGALWVSTLPGGPEDPSLGARGSVYQVNATTGAATKVATGFLGATNLAVHPDGTIYVAELFGDKITQLRGTQRSTFRSIDSPLALEVKGGSLYVGTFADIEFGPEGPVVKGPGSVQILKR